jgi:steroid delta-isomerase-like uncharacterized protein
MQDGKALVRQFYDAAWSNGDLGAARGFLADDLVDHNPLSFQGRADGAAGLLQVVAMIRAALPDLQRTIDDQISEGDRVVTRFTDRATHRGALLGIQPTGREVMLQGINIERIRGGKIAELWHVEDLAGLMRQISEPSAQTA